MSSTSRTLTLSAPNPDLPSLIPGCVYFILIMLVPVIHKQQWQYLEVMSYWGRQQHSVSIANKRINNQGAGEKSFPRSERQSNLMLTIEVTSVFSCHKEFVSFLSVRSEEQK